MAASTLDTARDPRTPAVPSTPDGAVPTVGRNILRPGPVRAVSAGDAGSAPAGVLAYIGGMVAIIAALTLVGQVLLAQARADTASDLASLAGADALAAASGDPCAMASDAVRRNGAVVIGCEVQEQDVLVTVAVDAGMLPAQQSTSRAGPAPTDIDP